jgi:non-homologous end joining protein Ku
VVSTEPEVSYSEIKKGYEVPKDKYVVVEKGDLDKIKLTTTNTMTLENSFKTRNLTQS